MAFVVFEGLDGSGKSTLIKELCAELDSRELSYKLSREPGGTELGEEVREILLRKEGDTPTPRCELLLYEAGRAHHVDCVIRPHLSQGDWVILDRYSASSLAFQAGGRKLDPKPIEWLNDYATDGVKPDLWVLLDLSVEESEKRMQKRGDEGQERDRFESEAKDFHERVRHYYLKLASEDSDNWLVLDASSTPQEMKSKLLTHLKERGCLQS